MKRSFLPKTLSIALILATLIQSMPFGILSSDTNQFSSIFLEVDFDHESESESENESQKDLKEKKGKKHPYLNNYTFATLQNNATLKRKLFLFKSRALDVVVPPPKA